MNTAISLPEDDERTEDTDGQNQPDGGRTTDYGGLHRKQYNHRPLQCDVHHDPRAHDVNGREQVLNRPASTTVSSSSSLPSPPS